MSDTRPVWYRPLQEPVPRTEQWGGADEAICAERGGRERREEEGEEGRGMSGDEYQTASKSVRSSTSRRVRGKRRKRSLLGPKC